MKASTVLAVAACVASASAFAPSNDASRVCTALSAEKKPFFQRVFDMDLFSPVADQNDYGARGKKNLKQGKIGDSSYIPAGLTAAEYNRVREQEAAKKATNYQKNVAKAGKFLDYTEFYKSRGTDTTDGWIKTPTRGHRMAKTKYDWSGNQDAKGYDGSK